MASAIFIDRDDTILATRDATARTTHVGDLTDPSQVRLLPGAVEACRLLLSTGMPLVCISNQGAVARGFCTLRDVEAVNDKMRALLAAEGVQLAATYVCPFHPDGSVTPFNREHEWRKPSAGMFLAAAADLGLNLATSWAIGDSQRDVQGAVTAGVASARAVIIGSGPGVWYADLMAAAKVIIAFLTSQSGALSEFAQRGQGAAGPIVYDPATGLPVSPRE